MPDIYTMATMEVAKWLIENSRLGNAKRVREWILDEVEDHDAYVYCAYVGTKPETPAHLFKIWREKLAAFVRDPIDYIEDHNKVAKRDVVLEWLAEAEAESSIDYYYAVSFDDLDELSVLDELLDDILNDVL